MADLSNWTIFLLVLKGTIAFYLIKSTATLAAWIFFTLRKSRFPSVNGTLDDIWFRQRDSNILIEEIHAVLTNRIRADEVHDLRAAMGRNPDSNRWVETLFFKRYNREHHNPSELEDFIEHSEPYFERIGRKGFITKLIDLRVKGADKERYYPWEQFTVVGDNVVKNQEL